MFVIIKAMLSGYVSRFFTTRFFNNTIAVFVEDFDLFIIITDNLIIMAEDNINIF